MSEEPAKKSGWGELGRSTAPEDRSGPGPAATVYWTGSLEFGRFNLDLSPPIQTGDTYITGGSGGVLESYHDAAKLSVWKSSGTPDRNACATTLAKTPSRRSAACSRAITSAVEPRRDACSGSTSPPPGTRSPSGTSEPPGGRSTWWCRHR
ncbi:hypothetical protein GCM10010174_86680 [Kutzneria viridogrisea]